MEEKTYYGLDSGGRPILDRAVGKLRKIESLPTTAQLVVNAFADLATEEKNQILREFLHVLSMDFTSGLEDGFGADFFIDENGKVNFEIDKLRVRDVLTAKEFLKQRIQVDNGNLLITSSGEGKVRSFTPITETTFYVEFETKGAGFVENDIVEASETEFSSAGSKIVNFRLVGRISSYIGSGDNGGDKYLMDFTGSGLSESEITAIFKSGSSITFVRMGNTANANRQDSILLTSDLSMSPLIAIYDAIDSVSDVVNYDILNPAKVRTAIGNLSSFSIPGVFNTEHTKIHGIYNIGHFYTGDAEGLSYLKFDPINGLVASGLTIENSGGANPIIWKGSLSSAPENPEVNWVYKNSTNGIVYIYTEDESWEVMTADGENGADGSNGLNGLNGLNGTNGTNGTNGDQGVRGAGILYGTGTTWSDTEARDAFLAIYGVLVQFDRYIVQGDADNAAIQKYCSNVAANTWTEYSTFINGNMVVDGSITASKIGAGEIDTSKLNFIPVQGTNVIASINASAEDGSLRISASRININSSVSFASGYNPTEKETPSGAQAKATAALNAAKSYADSGFGGLGDLAYVDLVMTALEDETIIVGGYIATSLIDADAVIANVANIKHTLTLGDAENDGVIQSHGFVTGSSGWQIAKSRAEFNDVIVRTGTGSVIDWTHIAVNSIESTNYVYSSGDYSSAGTKIDLTNGSIISKNFAIDSSGNAKYKGSLESGISITSPVITGGTIKGTTFISNSTDTGRRVKTTEDSILFYDATDIVGDINGHYGFIELYGAFYIDGTLRIANYNMPSAAGDNLQVLTMVSGAASWQDAQASSDTWRPIDASPTSGHNDNSISSAWAYGHATDVSAHHSRYTDSEAVSACSGIYANNAHTHSIYEPVISIKNSAFNKSFGTSTGTVADGGTLNTHTANTDIHYQHPARTDNAFTVSQSFSGATVPASIAVSVTGTGLGHVSAASASITTRTLAYSDLGAIPKASGSTSGGIITGGDISVSNGIITINDDSHNHIISNIDGLQSALDAKPAKGETGFFYDGDMNLITVVDGAITDGLQF